MIKIIKEKRKEKITDEDVEQAERYVAALERIEELTKGMNFTEDDMSDAERYLATLKEIENMDLSFTEDDISEAGKYLETLIAINENK